MPGKKNVPKCSDVPSRTKPTIIWLAHQMPVYAAETLNEIEGMLCDLTVSKRKHIKVTDSKTGSPVLVAIHAIEKIEINTLA